MTTINITRSKLSNVEFDLSIKGLDEDNLSVRLVVLNVFDNCDLAVTCKPLDGSKWAAPIPANIEFSKDNYKFRIEVVVDEYYFAPASGDVAIIAEPVVKIQEYVKPTVVATFESVDDNTQLDEHIVEEIDESTVSSPEALTPPSPELITQPVAEQETNSTPKPKRGSLFDRTLDGKLKIKGLDSKEIATKKLENTLKVQQILNK